MGFILKKEQKAWEEGQMPYQITPNQFSAETEIQIRKAFQEWERHTNWDFEEFRREVPEDHVVFSFEEGVYSSELGRQGGMQRIKMGSRDVPKSVIMKLIGRAMGLAYEHQRPDALRHFSFDRNSIEIGTPHLRQIQSDNFETIGEYDLTSIMHYEGDTAKRFYDGFIPRLVTYTRTFSINQASFFVEVSVAQGATRFYTVLIDPRGFLTYTVQALAPEDEIWIQTEFLQVGETLFCLLLNPAGDLQIREMKADGSMGEDRNRLRNEGLNNGVMRTFTTSQGAFVALYDPEKGDVQVFNLTEQGEKGELQHEYNYRAGLDVINFFEHLGKVTLCIHKRGRQEVFFRGINENGSLADDFRGEKENWADWSSIEFFYQEVDGETKTFLFAMDDTTGNYQVWDMGRIFTLDLVEEGNYDGPGLDHIHFYQPSNGKLHAFFLDTERRYRVIRTVQDGPGQEGQLGAVRPYTDDPTIQVLRTLGMSDKTHKKLQLKLGLYEKPSEGDIAAANARLADPPIDLVAKPAPGTQIFTPAK